MLALVGLARKVALRFGCESIGWTVYAVDCAQPNLKLRRVLLRRGFEVSGAAYRLTELVGQTEAICLNTALMEAPENSFKQL